MKTCYQTDPGKVRSHNEDSVTIVKNLKGEYLLVVADGMGGHKAGEIASSVDAEKLIILTDVPGVLRDPNDPDSLIQRIKIDEVPDLIEEGVISGGMIPKIETCVKAIEDGVKSCHIIDGRKKHSLLLEIFTKNGIGTMIYK